MLQLKLPTAIQFKLTPREGGALSGIFQISSNQSSAAEVRPAEVRPAKVCYNTPIRITPVIPFRDALVSDDSALFSVSHFNSRKNDAFCR